MFHKASDARLELRHRVSGPLIRPARAVPPAGAAVGVWPIRTGLGNVGNGPAPRQRASPYLSPQLWPGGPGWRSSLTPHDPRPSLPEEGSPRSFRMGIPPSLSED